jgi:hypothetical protein
MIMITIVCTGRSLDAPVTVEEMAEELPLAPEGETDL